MHSNDPDDTLVLAARSGDKEAFAILIDRHRTVLLALCRRTLGDRLCAEDAAHEATLQALLNLDGLRRPERFGPWLCGIGLNVCRRWLRERAKDYWSWEALCGGRYVAEATDPTTCPEMLVETADLTSRVRSAVEILPPGSARPSCSSISLA